MLKIRLILIATVLLCFAATAFTSPRADPVLQRLARADVFAFGAVGFTGAITQGEKDYRLILSRASAQADFEGLFAVGNSQAKCYALAGIFKLNSKRFTQLAAELLESKTKVTTMSGCIMSKPDLGTVIKKIESGNLPGV